MDSLLVILIVILVIVILIRGPKTLPLIGNMLGRGVKEVRKEASEFQKERDATSGDQPTPPTPPAPPA
jgi:TatA/E family protein of Tat protein translocase